MDQLFQFVRQYCSRSHNVPQLDRAMFFFDILNMLLDVILKEMENLPNTGVNYRNIYVTLQNLMECIMEYEGDLFVEDIRNSNSEE